MTKKTAKAAKSAPKKAKAVNGKPKAAARY
jgi:hypothetical protein